MNPASMLMALEVCLEADNILSNPGLALMLAGVYSCPGREATVPRREGPKTTRLKKERRDRMHEALGLRLSGYPYRAIAKAMKISVATAHKYVEDALKDITRDRAEEVLDLELHRCDELLAVAYEKAVRGDLFAMDRCLAIMTKIEKLHGVESPKAADEAKETYDMLTQLLSNSIKAAAATPD